MFWFIQPVARCSLDSTPTSVALRDGLYSQFSPFVVASGTLTHPVFSSVCLSALVDRVMPSTLARCFPNGSITITPMEHARVMRDKSIPRAAYKRWHSRKVCARPFAIVWRYGCCHLRCFLRCWQEESGRAQGHAFFCCCWCVCVGVVGGGVHGKGCVYVKHWVVCFACW